MKFRPMFLAVALLFSGCSLIPKPVEFFQDKVHKLPVAKQSEKETQRQAALRAKEKAGETYNAAIATVADPKVVAPAAETVLLTDAVAESVGPPVSPASPDKATADLARELRTSIARLNQRIESFREDNDENAGKKIEGTGLFQVPYFVWLGGFLVFGLIIFVVMHVVWSFVKVAGMANPPVQLGVTAATLGANFLKKSVSELAKGGEEFKSKLSTVIDDPDMLAAVKELFTSSHKEAQSSDVQDLVKTITRKE